MAKITVHGGPSAAGAQVVSAGWSDESEPNTWPTQVGEDGQEEVTPPAGVEGSLADGEDQGPGVADETVGGDFKPLPEAVDGDTTEHVSEPDYDDWTVKQLREALANRQPPLPTDGLKADLVARLCEADAAASDG